jgi:hypothetical protein
MSFSSSGVSPRGTPSSKPSPSVIAQERRRPPTTSREPNARQNARSGSPRSGAKVPSFEARRRPLTYRDLSRRTSSALASRMFKVILNGNFGFQPRDPVVREPAKRAPTYLSATLLRRSWIPIRGTGCSDTVDALARWSPSTTFSTAASADFRPYFAFGPIISSGRTKRSKSSALTSPSASAASRSVEPSLCAFFAILAALS